MMEIEHNQATQLELFKPSEITRPDINIGKWAGWLFASPWSKGLYESKVYSWETNFEGETVKASIKVRPIDGRKRPTTTTYRVFLALIQIWEYSGKPESGEIFFSARQLANTLEFKSFNSDTANRLQEQLDILANTAISWAFSFAQGNNYQNLINDMHIIDEHTYFEKGNFLKREMFKQKQSVILNRRLVRNMLEGLTKPIQYKAFISIKNDSSANLYTLLDNFLSQKEKWERRSHGLLFEDLEFSGKRYESKRTRHAKLKEFVNDLDSKELSSGKLSLSIEETADKSDYKLVARKTPRVKKKNRRPAKIANDKADIPLIVDDIIEGLEHIGSTAGISRGVLETLALWYPREMLFNALSIVKSDLRGNIKKSAIRAYMYQVHVMAHERGKEWIRECGKDCKHRPENRLTLEQLMKKKTA